MQFRHLYIHIPFCTSRCNYCDFTSYTIAEHQQFAADYGNYLLKELSLWQNRADLSDLQTVYIGGGTPSLLNGGLIAELLQQLKPQPQAEITLEANPDSLDAAKLSAWQKAGVNRLSLGAQSFDDTQLKAMGRAHNAAQIKEAVALAKAQGYQNISIDLIYGLPNQSLAAWQDDLEQAIALNSEHISLYGLNIHEDTPWAKADIKLNDDLAADMLELAISHLAKANFKQYEISNFAKANHYSQHNYAYWQRKNYLGLGVAAASCYKDKRWCNERDLAKYRAKLASNELAIIEQEDLSIEIILAEAMFLNLRLTAGLNLAEFAEQYGINPLKYYKKAINKAIKNGLMEADENSLKLTGKGLLLSNEVFADFL